MIPLVESFAIWLADYYVLSTVLLALAVVGMSMLRQPAQRLAIAKSTLVALVLLASLCALPGWSLVHLIRAEQPEAAAALPQEPLTTAINDDVLDSRSIAPESIQPFQQNASVPSTKTTASRAWTLPELSWSAWLALVHVGGAVCVMAWLALGWLAAQRLRRQSRPAPDDLKRMLREIAGPSDALGERVQLLTCDRIDVAVALGNWRPAVLLPAQWVNGLPLPAREGPGEGLSCDHLRMVLAHEWTHIHNHDLHWLAASRALLVLLWAQPLYWLLRRRMRLDQETLADAAAAELSSRQRYAEQLVAWAHSIGSRPAVRVASAVGLWEGPSQLRQRVAMLINEHFTLLRQCSRRWRMACSTLIAVAVIALSMVTLQPATLAEEEEDKQAASNAPIETRHTVQGLGSVGVFRAGTLPQPATHKKNAIAVQVVDEADQPIAGVDALLYRASLQNGKHELVKKVETNERGEVEFVGLVAPARVAEYEKIGADKKIPPPPDASFIVALKRPGLSTVMVYGSDFDVALRGARRNVRMRPAAELRGRVTDSQGQPVAGALVAVGGWGGTFAVEGVNAVNTDAEGRYVFADRAAFDAEAARVRQRNDFRAATAAVREERAGSDPYDAASDLAASDLVIAHPDFAVTKARGGDIPGTSDVQLAPASSIAGRVVQFDSGQHASGVLVKAVGRQQLSRETSGDTDFAVTSFHSAATQTDERGQYRLTNLPAGDYDLWAQPPGNDWKDIEWVSRGIGGVKAKPGREPTAAPDLVIGPGGKIRGRLIDLDSGKTIRAGDDGAFLRTYVQFVDGPQMQDTLMQSVPVTPEGTFEIRTFPDKVRYGVFVYLHKSGDVGQLDYQTDDDLLRSGPVLEVDHGQSVDATFMVQPMAKLEELRSQQREAYELSGQQKWDEAIAAFTDVLAKYPTNTSMLVGRGRAHVKAGHYAEAVADFEALLDQSPDDIGAKLLLADLLATSPVADARDGRRALKLATDAAASARKSPFDSEDLSWALSIAAAAHAELGELDKAVASQKEAIELAPESRQTEMQSRLELYKNKKPFRRQPADGAAKQGMQDRSAQIRLVQNTTAKPRRSTTDSRPPALLSYGDGKPDGKKSYGGSGHMIRFELPEGVTKVRGIRIHGSRYGLPQAPDEDFEITFLSDDREETLHSEAAPYHLFKRGTENWVRVLFDEEVELPQKFWIALNFNAEQTKGVYVSYDTSTKGEYSRVGLPGDEDEPKETDFGGDWMVQVMLPRPEK